MLSARAPPQTPLGELTALPRPLAVKGEEGDLGAKEGAWARNMERRGGKGRGNEISVPPHFLAPSATYAISCLATNALTKRMTQTMFSYFSLFPG